MNAKKKVRVVLDVLLSIMIVFEMFIQFTGDFLHEVVGFAFFATVVVHLALSAAWMKNTAAAIGKGKMTARRTALAVMGGLLAVTMAVLGVSSVAISGLLADAGFVWPLGAYAVWATVHAISSYALCALVVVHLAMHWAFLASAFHVPYDPSRRRAIGTGVHAVAAVGALALGVMAAKSAIPGSASVSGVAIGEASSNGNGKTLGDVSDELFSSGDSAASSSASASSKGAHKGKKMRGDSDSSSGAAPGTAESGSNDSGSGSDSDLSFDVGSGSSSDLGADSSSQQATGICTLCRKRCSLSAPKCNKPYAAGLI